MSLPGVLARAGVLGINRRNLEFALRWNDRRLYPRVDDKLETKRLCEEAGIPTAKVLMVARYHAQLRDLTAAVGAHESFALKPARGAMGKGIMIVTARDGDRFRRSDGSWISARDVQYHAAGILSGLYSLGGHLDVAFVEERLILHPGMAAIASDGVPDIRVVVYRGIPVMAMTRLPTRRSRGRANLHQGAVGAGVDLDTGRTNHAVLHNTPISTHPDTGHPVLRFAIPHFARALGVAVSAVDQTGLGYVGADVVVDAVRGPLILELNARPGLGIQLANRAGLLGRLRAVDRGWRRDLSLDERIAFGRSLASAASEKLLD